MDYELPCWPCNEGLYINGCVSSPKSVLSGIPQGSVLGPLLFLIFINNTYSQLQCEYKIFVDDLKLYLHFAPSSISGQASQELQSSIDMLSATTFSWGFRFSSNKFVHLRFARQRHVMAENLHTLYTLYGTPINHCSTHKDLGVIVDNKLKFLEHIGGIVAEVGGVATNLLRSPVCRSAGFMSSLYISEVRSILDFVSPECGTWVIRVIRNCLNLCNVD